ncbi:NlpC/P60 family protein [Vibrio maerlii]|uniref:NlpC/P60 family protein n=1 Tax=Vibrio maerlii TaxID=2231648 RepID=UPI001F146D1E|nr:NlpC/P60 family protein [Vibrio maerlii]
MQLNLKYIVFTSLLTLGLLGCSSDLPLERTKPTSNHFRHDYRSSVFEPIYQDWRGTPYRLGGQSKSGIDCSAFVQVAYQQALAINLPRTTKLQSQLGQEVSYRTASSGDLVFFKTGVKVRHVGVYLGNNAFMHASTSKGVVVSRLDNPYWADAFWQFRRVTN